MLCGLVDGRLVATIAICAVLFAPTDGIATLQHFDGAIFVVLILAFVVVSAIGTRIVLRCGDLPANDELFNLRELTPAQQAALRGDHISEASKTST